ncbi:MAG: tetratricopeptide repeat protein [Cryomorphaceae bacterium]|nr:hypothetical protein [Flavobacteriales bacterium]
MKYYLLLIVFVLGSFRIAIAQEDFADLSSKERISIAEKEAKESKSDAVFQELMQEAHVFFEQKKYLKAIHKYEEAQERRPYNVYPKVIIADIELSMKDTLEVLRAAEKQEEAEKEQKPLKPKKEEPEPPEPEEPEETREERLEKLDNWEEKERERRARERAAREKKESEKPSVRADGGDVAVGSIADFQKDLAEKYPNGITEKTEKQGNKTVVTRIIVANNKGNEYKKVTHDWGGVFYFKNGDAVTERVWKQETEDKK